jgi:hypothetical protein
MGSPAPTPPPHTLVMFLLGGGTASFSADCVKLLTDAKYDPAAFGKLDQVEQATTRAKQRVADYKALKDKADPNAESARPSDAEFLMSECEPQKLTSDPSTCAAQQPAGPARSPSTGNGTEASDGHRGGANGGDAAAPIHDAAAAREEDKPQLARSDGQPPRSSAALAPEARAHAAVDESIGAQAQAGGNQAPASSRSKEKGTAEVQGKTAGECIDNFVKQSMEDLQHKFKEAKPAAERGMDPAHDEAFKDLAKKNNEIILVRDSNPKALDWMDKEPRADLRQSGVQRFASKTEAVKAKSRKDDPNAGLAALDPADPHYAADKEKYEKAGFTVLPDQGHILVRKEDGAAFFSDYDLHGTYDKNTGQSTWPDGDQQQKKIDDYNKALNSKMVNHGPHDEWKDRNNPDVAGKNAGPKPPVTAYTPDGDPVALDSVADMKAFYLKNCMKWPYTE